MDKFRATVILEELIYEKYEVTCVTLAKKYNDVTGKSISRRDFAYFLQELCTAKDIAQIGFDKEGRPIYTLKDYPIYNEMEATAIVSG